MFVTGPWVFACMRIPMASALLTSEFQLRRRSRAAWSSPDALRWSSPTTTRNGLRSSKDCQLKGHTVPGRQALLAIVRSELSASLLERCSAALLALDGALLVELCVAVPAGETVSPARSDEGRGGKEYVRRCR